MTTHATPAPAHAVSADTAPHEISEEDRRSLQEAYRMIHTIAADIEDEKRRSAEEAASAVSVNTARAQKETATSPSTSTATVS